MDERKFIWSKNTRLNYFETEEASSPLDEGKKICEEIIQELIDLKGISGVHLMGPNCEDQCAELIKYFR